MISKDTGFNLNITLSERNRNIIFVIISLLVFLILIYHNSLEGEWTFDDYPNIVENKSIQLKSLNFEDLKEAFTQTNGYRQYTRPLAFLSFALNFYVGGLNVFGFHLVNFAIHFITAIFVFLFIFEMLQLPLLGDKYKTSAYAISALAVFFWASSPVNVNAVSYIVQRMTSLAGMAYIISLFSYIKARTSERSITRWAYWCSCAFFFTIAVFVKENSAMLIFIIALFEIFFFRSASRYRYYIIISSCILFFTVGGIYLIFWSQYLSYQGWTFTMPQRLLTQPAIIFYYVSLLIYPLESRLAFEHDFLVFRGLFDPWYAIFPSILLISVVFLLFHMRKKCAVISFCFIFFLLNHAIEGSFIPLDFVFEHRNYVPSMLFFVPFSMFLINVLDYFANKRVVQFTLAFLIVFLLVAQGHTVYMRNDFFRYSKLVWEDTIKKNPDLSRPHAVMSKIFYDEKNLAGAFHESTLALQKNKFPHVHQLALYNINLASALLCYKGEDDVALQHYIKAAQLAPIGAAYEGIAVIMLRKGRLKEALESSEKAMIIDKQADINPNYPLILMKMGQYEKAIKIASAGLIQRIPKGGTSFQLYAVLGETAKKKGKYRTAAMFWQNILDFDPSNIPAHFSLIEIYYHEKENKKLNMIIFKLLMVKGDKKISDLIDDEKKMATLSAYNPNKVLLLKIIRTQLRNLDISAL